MENQYTLNAIIQPGLEQLLNQEISWKLTEMAKLNNDENYLDILKSIKTGKGLVSIILPTSYIEVLLVLLKTPTKILMPIHQFKASDFPRLFNETLKFNWSKLVRSKNFDIKAKAKQSRLIHSDKIEQTVQDALIKYFQNHPLKKGDFDHITNQLHLKIENDQCIMSLDISAAHNGNPFYYHGYKKINSKASLRENLSYLLCQQASNFYQDSFTIIDPFCGSGTILIESLDLPKENNFLFHSLKHNFPKLPKQKIARLKMPKQLIANDLDSDMIKATRTNLQSHFQNIIYYQTDINELELNSDIQHSIIITNMPYNKRIKANIKSLLNSIVQLAIKNQSNAMIILGPKDYQSLFESMNFRVSYQFRNGGFPVNIYERTIKST